ncbi:bifunctional glycosyltransferase family 2/GtrA family protein [Brachybacterium subflavum]|uniref:bifunctional glycosyltransferase family 2/GtrA family protein n=1 Tax=Brachybacterium subflavum TaxID=2585206 RepID=UPI001266878A|nr:bifunctional glycosyltransferase family 2/GtrA family protein [Brachybacterium subflavum]
MTLDLARSAGSLSAGADDTDTAPGSRAGGHDPSAQTPQDQPQNRPLVSAEPGTTVLDVVVPVLNERHTIEACVERLDRHLRSTFPYPFRITVADNGSTDGTRQITADLEERMPDRVRAVHLDRKGRGRALKSTWSASDALVLAYMDVDLSTDLDALWPLVAPLMSGHSDLAIGTRLHRSSRVVRGTKREFISRCYNAGLSVALGAGFTDAQCGFKAIRADVAREVLPLVEDPAWFFDTELLVLAERSGLRIHEVPVDWYDDPDSRVDVVGTALDDIRGVLRVRRSLRSGELGIDGIRARLGRTMPSGQTGGQVIRFAAVGVASTLLHLAGFAALHGLLGTGAQTANILALLVATIVNTSANRSWTFGIREREGTLWHQLQGLALLALTWALSAGALLLLDSTWPQAPTAVQTVILGGSMVIATVTKFGVMRRWRRDGTTAAHDAASGRRTGPAPTV